MKNIKWLLLFVCAAVLFAVVSCSKKADVPEKTAGGVPVRVAIWGDTSEKEIITKTVDDWQKSHPHINVQLEHIPAGNYIDKVLTEIAGGNPPDIIFCEVNVFVTLFYKNALMDLMPLLGTDKSFDIKNFFPEVVARFTRDGKVFCIPRDTAPFACIYYNKNIFDKYKVPYPTGDWDMDKFIDTAKKLTFDEAGKHPGEAGFNDKKIACYGFWGWTWQNFVYSYGGQLVDDINNPTKCLLGEKPAIDGMQAFVDLSYKYGVSPKPDALSNSGMSINQLFSMGKLAMYQSGIWDTPGLKRSVGDKFDWDIAMFPKGPSGKRGFGTGGSGYAILKACKNPKEAWEVVKCLSGDAGQEMLADTGLAQPANQNIASGKHWAGSIGAPKNKGMLNQAVKYVYYEPFHPLWREASDKFINQQVDLIIHKQLPVEEGMKRTAAKVDALLSGKSEK